MKNLGAIIRWTACFLIFAAMAWPQAPRTDRGRSNVPNIQGNGARPDFTAMRDSYQSLQTAQNYWLALSFDPKIEDAKLNALRPAFQKAWDARDKARTSMRGSTSITSATSELKLVNADLEQAIEKVLTKEQIEKMKASSENMGRGPVGNTPGNTPGNRPGRTDNQSMEPAGKPATGAPAAGF